VHHAWEEIEKLHVALHVLDCFGRELHSDEPMDQAMFGFLALHAQTELAMIKQRIRKRVNENFDQHLLIGTLPYGWDKEQCGSRLDRYTGKTKPIWRLVPNPFERSILLRMDRQSKAGCSDNEIARQLNTDGISTKTPKGTPIKLRIGRNGEPDVWGVTSGKWQGMQVKTILESRHTKHLLEESYASLDAGGTDAAIR
jgi:DNA invertase Pin-like site-specific DNA recombinase